MRTHGGKNYITAQEMIAAALASGEVSSIRYIVKRENDPTVTAIAEIRGQEYDATETWGRIFPVRANQLAPTYDDRISVLKKRCACRLIRELCPNILSKLASN
jgi:hypothetical protein